MTQIDVSPVDWARPIEAVHISGRVVPVGVAQRLGDGDYKLTSPLFTNPNQAWYFKQDGSQRYEVGSVHGGGYQWRIRNRQEPQSTDPKMVERALRLVQKMAGRSEMHATGHDYDEARSIAKEYFSPQTDEEWAEQLAGDTGLHARLIARGIAKGRELEREGK